MIFFKNIGIRSILFALALSPVAVSVAGNNTFPPEHLHQSASFDKPTKSVERLNEVAWYLNASKENRDEMKTTEIHDSSPRLFDSNGSVVIYADHLNTQQKEAKN